MYGTRRRGAPQRVSPDRPRRRSPDSEPTSRLVTLLPSIERAPTRGQPRRPTGRRCLRAAPARTRASRDRSPGPAPRPAGSSASPRATPVPWLAPLLLISTGLRTLLAVLFGAYLDKRELQNALPAVRSTSTSAPDGELWLDYVADLGDGFNATYSVAYLLAQPAPRGRRAGGCPAAQVLVMGGDQVYPTASGEAYEDRFKGPYQAALPEPPADGPAPTLYAVPGNHDWYDGLTAFLRLFAAPRDGTIGGWRTRQSRSYFALQLPADWWLFGAGRAVRRVPRRPAAGATSSEVATAARPRRPGHHRGAGAGLGARPSTARRRTTAIDYFMRTVIAPTGAQVRLLLSGDLHHYARYAGAGPPADHLRWRRRLPLPDAQAAGADRGAAARTRWSAGPARRSRTTWRPLPGAGPVPAVRAGRLRPAAAAQPRLRRAARRAAHPDDARLWPAWPTASSPAPSSGCSASRWW